MPRPQSREDKLMIARTAGGRPVTITPYNGEAYAARINSSTPRTVDLELDNGDIAEVPFASVRRLDYGPPITHEAGIASTPGHIAGHCGGCGWTGQPHQIDRTVKHILARRDFLSDWSSLQEASTVMIDDPAPAHAAAYRDAREHVRAAS